MTGLRAGRTNREISDFNNIPCNTVKGFAREYHCFLEEGGEDGDFDIKRKQHCRRSDAYGPEIVAQIQALINDNPGHSMRKIAVDLNRSGPPAHLTAVLLTILCGAWLREVSIGPPTRARSP